MLFNLQSAAGSEFIIGDMNLDGAVFALIHQTGAVSKIILFILFLISLFSWGIFIQKYIQFTMNRISIDKFKKLFNEKLRDRSPGDLIMVFSKNTGNILAKAALSGLLEIKEQLKVKRDKRINYDMNFYTNAYVRASNSEASDILSEFEKLLGILATAGSVSPFLGLFGTVWGLMSAFQALGLQGSVSIGAVAPGLAQALLTTAAGLITAIPAVICYNYLINAIRKMQNEMVAFNSQVQGLVERYLFVSRDNLAEGMKNEQQTDS